MSLGKLRGLLGLVAGVKTTARRRGCFIDILVHGYSSHGTDVLR